MTDKLHSSLPLQPIVATSAIVMAVQTLISRKMNPLESGVVSITQIDAGDGAHNVIPNQALIRGTIRALSDEALLQLREGLVHIVSTTASAHGCKLASSTFALDHYPVTMNDGKLYPFAAKVAGLISDSGEHTDVDPVMGAEDFAFLAQGVPSAFFFLGQGGKGNENNGKEEDGSSSCGKCGRKVPTNLNLHHPKFNLDEDILARGVELFVNLALRSLKDLS